MNIEREKKFLVNIFKLPIDIHDKPPYEIQQGYLKITDTEQVRVRLVEGMFAKIGYKKYINETDREEYEEFISQDLAKKILSMDIPKLFKKRYKYLGWDIDYYPFGLVTAEFEFSDQNPLPDPLPEWIDRDVTSSETASNIFIAQNWKDLYFISK